MTHFRDLLIGATLLIGCTLVLPCPAGAMGSKPDAPAAPGTQAKTDAAKAPASATSQEKSAGKNAEATRGGNQSAPMDPGNALGLTGLGMPSMAIGGTEDALSPVGGMGSMGTDSGFSPFFDGSVAPQ